MTTKDAAFALGLRTPDALTPDGFRRRVIAAYGRGDRAELDTLRTLKGAR